MDEQQVTHRQKSKASCPAPRDYSSRSNFTSKKEFLDFSEYIFPAPMTSSFFSTLTAVALLINGTRAFALLGRQSLHSHRRFITRRAAQTIDITLTKPMGLVFEENNPKIGGIYISEVQPPHLRKFGAELQEGDQLLSVGGKSARGLSFDDAMGLLIDSDPTAVPLSFARGTAPEVCIFRLILICEYFAFNR